MLDYFGGSQFRRTSGLLVQEHRGTIRLEYRSEIRPSDSQDEGTAHGDASSLLACYSALLYQR